METERGSYFKCPLIYLQVVPKILTVLESGCHKGQISPQCVYPNVLPLVSQLVPKILSASKDDSDASQRLSKFYSKLLSAVQQGLQHFLSLAPKLSGQQLMRKGGSSTSAKLAAEAYFDIVLFSVTTHQQREVDDLVGSKVVDWTSDVVRVGENHLEAEIVFRSLSTLIRQLEKKFGGQSSSEFYSNLLQKLSELALEVYNAGRLESASKFLTGLIGNSTGADDKKEKKGGLKFSDESENSSGNAFLTSYFRCDASSGIADISTSNISFRKLPVILQSTIVEAASNSVQKVLSEFVNKESRLHVQFLTDIFNCFSGDADVGRFYSQLLKESASTNDAAVELLQAFARSKLLSEAAGNRGLVDFCLVIARAIAPDSKLVLYESLFERTGERGVTDWLLASLLQAEEDGSLHKRSILAGNAFAGKLRRISDELRADQPSEVCAGTWSLMGIAFLNSNLVSAETCGVVLTGLASAVKNSGQSNEPLIKFINDLFLFWQSHPDLGSEMVCSDGGKSLVFELFQLSCNKRSIFGVDVTSVWTQGIHKSGNQLQDIVQDFLVDASSFIKETLFVENVDIGELVYQTYSLLDVVRSAHPESWQKHWLETLPGVTSAVAQNVTENIVLFSVNQDVHLSILNLRSLSKNSQSAVRKLKKSTEFFLQTASQLLNDAAKVDLSSELLEVLAVSVACHLKELEPEALEPVDLLAQRIVQKSLSGSSKEKLKEIVFQNSKTSGWEWSLALNSVLTWLQDDPECQKKFKLSDLSPVSNFWSESELQTLQVLSKFSAQSELRDLILTEVGCLLSLQTSEAVDKIRVTTSLILLSTALRHLDMDSEVEIRENVKSVLELVAYLRQTKEDDFLFATNVGEKCYADVAYVVAVCRFLTLSVTVLHDTEFVKLENTDWDLILCSLSSWVQSVDESSACLKKASASKSSKQDVDQSKVVATFCVATFELTSAVAEAIDRFDILLLTCFRKKVIVLNLT